LELPHWFEDKDLRDHLGRAENCDGFGRPALGKAIPYGVYDIAQNVGW
jgi:hypothetical protein